MSLELTNLEQVFLETGKEDSEPGSRDTQEVVQEVEEEESDTEALNVDDAEAKGPFLGKVFWRKEA